MWGPLIQRWLDELLPADADRVCSGRVGLFTLALWPLKPQRLFVAEYESKADLIDTAMASVHIPYFLDGRLRRVCVWTCVSWRLFLTHSLLRLRSRRYRGRRCIDGSVFAARDIVDTRKRFAAAAAAGSGAVEAPTLLVDHNADPAVANNRKTGDFVVRCVPLRACMRACVSQRLGAGLFDNRACA